MPRVLDRNTYDTLEFAALALGGIGAGADYVELSDAVLEPWCAHGCAMDGELPALSSAPFIAAGLYWDVNDLGVNRLHAAGIGRTANDVAVRAINRRKHHEALTEGKFDHSYDENARVSFAEWCAELDVVRGRAK